MYHHPVLEKIAVACGLANIYLTVRQNIWCWPVGVVMVSLYIYIFFNAKLYSDAGLNVFFPVMQFYGWYHWTRGGVEHSRSLSAVKRLSATEWAWTIGGVLAGTAALGTAMHRLTDAALPYPDAFTTLLSVFAQFLMTKKFLENWILWIIADLIYVPMYVYKHLPVTALLYAVFLLLAVLGLRRWWRSYQRQLILGPDA